MDILTLEDFKMWSATALKSFLAVRNKSVDGSFEELASRLSKFKDYSRTNNKHFQGALNTKTRHAGRANYQKRDIPWHFISLHLRASSNIFWIFLSVLLGMFLAAH